MSEKRIYTNQNVIIFMKAIRLPFILWPLTSHV